MKLNGTPCQRNRTRTKTPGHGACQTRQLGTGRLQNCQGSRISLRRRGHRYGQPADITSAATTINKITGRSPIRTANAGKHFNSHWRITPAIGALILGTPYLPQRFACNPVTTTAIVKQIATTTSSMHLTVFINECRNRTGTRVNNIARTGCENIEIGNFNIIAQPNSITAHANYTGDQTHDAVARFAALIKSCHACANIGRLSRSPHIMCQLGECAA